MNDGASDDGQTLLIGLPQCRVMTRTGRALPTKGDRDAPVGDSNGIINKYPLAGFLIGTSAAAPL